jgi:hypothetical protein
MSKGVFRPEHAVMIAVLLIVVTVLAAAGGILAKQDGLLIGLVVLIGGAAALAALGYGRKLRRAQRPEWLETQAWRQGLVDKIEGRKPEA